MVSEDDEERGGGDSCESDEGRGESVRRVRGESERLTLNC